MPRRTAPLCPMFPMFPMSAPSHPPATPVGSLRTRAAREAAACGKRPRLDRLMRVTLALALLGSGALAHAQTPVCFDSVGRALPPEQCSQAARDQAAAQAAASGAGSPSLRDECRALADKIANTPDKPVYTRDRPVVAPNGNRIDIPTRTNPRKALKEEYMRKCT